MAITRKKRKLRAGSARKCIHCKKTTLVRGNAIRQTCYHCGKTTTARDAKKSEITELLDRLHSLVVRKSAADDDGNVSCVTCGKVMQWRDSEAGHFIGRTNYSTRWMDDNVHVQCRQCNGFKFGEVLKHRRWIENNVGKGSADDLEAIGINRPPLTLRDKASLAKRLNERCEELGIKKYAYKVRKDLPAPWIQFGVTETETSTRFRQGRNA